MNDRNMTYEARLTSRSAWAIPKQTNALVLLGCDCEPAPWEQAHRPARAAGPVRRAARSAEIATIIAVLGHRHAVAAILEFLRRPPLSHPSRERIHLIPGKTSLGIPPFRMRCWLEGCGACSSRSSSWVGQSREVKYLGHVMCWVTCIVHCSATVGPLPH